MAALTPPDFATLLDVARGRLQSRGGAHEELGRFDQVEGEGELLTRRHLPLDLELKLTRLGGGVVQAIELVHGK